MTMGNRWPRRALDVMPATDWAREVAAFQAPYLGGAVMYAREHATARAHAQAVRKHLRVLFARAEVWVRTQPDNVTPILQYGLRNVFHTRPVPDFAPTHPIFRAEDMGNPARCADLMTAMDQYNRSGAFMLDRLEMEEKAFNIPKDAPATVRPVYGYFSEDSNARLLESGGHLRMLDGFGRVALRVSRDVRPFMTACGFDLVALTLTNLGPMELPRGVAALTLDDVAGVRPAVLTGSPGYPVGVEWMTEHAWPWAYHLDPLAVSRLDDLKWHTEAQIHAPVYGTHVQEIVTTQPLPPKALAQAKRLGIPVRILALGGAGESTP